MVGAEGPGLDPASLEAADLRVRIPIDDAVDSLNVVVAAGIALNQLRPGGGGVKSRSDENRQGLKTLPYQS